jgi:hypothetical protein
MAETLRTSAAWEITVDRDRATPATRARERLNMGFSGSIAEKAGGL